MNKNKLAVMIFLVSIALLLVALYLNFMIVLEKNEIASSLHVDELASFDIGKQELTFGKIIPGSSSQRELIIENTYDFPVRIELKSEGNITQFLYFDNSVNLEVGEGTSVRIDAIIPTNQTYGDYSGIFTITTKRDIF